jgi:beta-glucosidase-like glycosyl hydrolase
MVVWWVFTDALDMKGLTKYFPEGEADLRAFLAGNDVLLFSQNVPLAIGKIQWAVKTGKVAPEELEARVKKILSAKYDVGLYKFSALDEKNVTADLNSKTNDLREKISRAAVTVVKDQAAMINKITAGKGKVGYININGAGTTHLDSTLQKKFPTLTRGSLPAKSTSATAKQLTDKLNNMDIVVVGVHNLALYPGKNGAYGLDAVQISALQQLSQKKNVIFAVMGNAYMVKNICNAKSIVLGYEDDLYSEEAVYEVLTGVLKAKGALPVKPCK